MSGMNVIKTEPAMPASYSPTVCPEIENDRAVTRVRPLRPGMAHYLVWTEHTSQRGSRLQECMYSLIYLISEWKAIAGNTDCTALCCSFFACSFFARAYALSD
jgi:hypothetical protein